ncbi:hypothetical protein LOD99_3942 [Oopsacas minuta]|uniref:60S ribosomal protein L7a n=1 Tax=Oopsacas minuta TaxID=111878 RepID=A0AAV7JW10_9METZ|nr:hypothetical protein LOD99_3942 [Oopsacas minuta]
MVKEYSISLRRVVGMLPGGLTQKMEASKLSINIRAIGRWWKLFQSRYSLENQTGRGRKSSVPKAAMIIISKSTGRRLQSTPKLSRNLKSHGYSILSTTIYRYLTKTKGVKSFKQQSEPLLTEKQRNSRLCFCKERSNWTAKDWRKVPPAIHQFTQSLQKQTVNQLFRLLHKYRPDTRKQKRLRLLGQAHAVVEGHKKHLMKKPTLLKFGINHVTTLIEEKKAKLVLIAHDVNPIELIVWLPALCRKMNVPYCIIKGKARLGQLVNMKTATTIALTDVRTEDKALLNTIIDSVTTDFNDRADEIRKHWGGGIMGSKSRARSEFLENQRLKELHKI